MRAGRELSTGERQQTQTGITHPQAARLNNAVSRAGMTYVNRDTIRRISADRLRGRNDLRQREWYRGTLNLQLPSLMDIS